MADHNIYVRNQLSGRSPRTSKLSAKSTISSQKQIMSSGGGVNIKDPTKYIQNMQSGSGSGVLSKGIKKIGGATGAVAMILTVGEKVARFGVNIYEARTGNTIASHNAVTVIDSITTAGTNYLFGSIKNELFNKQVISRQNFANDYGRELYDINGNGKKNKRI